MNHIFLVCIVVFSTAVTIVFYCYVIFPAILSVLAGRKKQPDAINSDLIPVSILISAYNEESVIRSKLESILNSDYPESMLEILIGSDGSTDRTNEIVSEMSLKHASLKLVDFKERRGKPSVINDLVRESHYDVVVLTDANVLFERQNLKKLLRNFRKKDVGLVGANILNVGLQRKGISHQEKSYIERENLIKYREGEIWGCMMGPFGGCFALRKELFEVIPSHFLVDDFYISMKVLDKGYKCINDLEAICYEDVSTDIREEYRRKARISAGNFQNLNAFRHFLFRPFTPVGFCFISHKVIRWYTPFFILLSLISLIFLSTDNHIFQVLLVGECLILLSPLIDFVCGKLGMHFTILRFVAYFTYMNLALLMGYIRYKKGVRSGVWTPTRRV